MSSLVPEKRMDKNQKLVTRYVKPVDAGKKPFVAPVPSVAGGRDDLIRNALSSLESPGINPNAYADLFATFKDSTLHMIVDNVSDSPETPVWVGELLPFLTRGQVSERDIREYITYAPSVDDSADADSLVVCLYGLRFTVWFEDCDDLSDVDEKTKEVVRTMLRLSIWARDEEDEDRYETETSIGTYAYDAETDQGYPSLQAPGLDDVVAAYPSRADDIIAFIQSRGYTGPDDLIHLLESGVHGQLIEGVL
jgi:hypothetical protein